MNPLPVLDPLDDPQSVFDPQADDLNALIADDQSNLDALLNSLGDQQNQAASALASYGTLLDQADAAITSIGQIFDALAAEQGSIDLAQTFADAFAADDALADAINTDQIDLGAIAQSLYDVFGAVLTAVYNILVGLINAVIQALGAAIQFLSDLINSLIGLIFS